MNERMRFVTDRERELYSMVELCERYGISRKTGYKWLARYEGEGVDGLRERSRAPHHCPHRIAANVAEAICAGRRQHPSWGPDKILHWLKRREPTMDLPATSTAGDLLARRGLVKKRRPASLGAAGRLRIDSIPYQGCSGVMSSRAGPSWAAASILSMIARSSAVSCSGPSLYVSLLIVPVNLNGSW